jgi:hypothetical protein
MDSAAPPLLPVSEHTTVAIWRGTYHALRLATAYNGETAMELMHRLVIRELKRAQRAAGVEYVERPSHQPPRPVSLAHPGPVSLDRPARKGAKVAKGTQQGTQQRTGGRRV